MSFDDKEFVGRLLAESGVEDTGSLNGTLLRLRAEGAGPVPELSDKLARLMSPKVVALRPRRTAVKAAGLGIAIAAAAGLGVSGVAAASPQFRTVADNTFQQIVRFFDSTPAVVPADPAAPGGPAAPERIHQNDAGRPASEADVLPPVPDTASAPTPAPSLPAEKPADTPAQLPGNRSAEPGDRALDRARGHDVQTPRLESDRGQLGLPPLPGVPVQPGAPADQGAPVPGGQGQGAEHRQPREHGPQPLPELQRHIDLPDIPEPEDAPGGSKGWSDLPRPVQPEIRK